MTEEVDVSWNDSLNNKSWVDLIAEDANCPAICTNKEYSTYSSFTGLINKDGDQGICIGNESKKIVPNDGYETSGRKIWTRRSTRNKDKNTTRKWVNNIWDRRDVANDDSINSILSSHNSMDDELYNEITTGNFTSKDNEKTLSYNLRSAASFKENPKTEIDCKLVTDKNVDGRNDLQHSTNSKKRKNKSNSVKKDDAQRYETNPDVLSRRQKQVDYGKNTIGYERYLQLVPKNKRASIHPKTPPKQLKYSRRAWDGLVKSWRLRLHKYDPSEGNEDGTHSDIYASQETISSSWSNSTNSGSSSAYSTRNIKRCRTRTE